PPVMDPAKPANILGECLQFADGYSWGSVNTADVYFPVSGEKATNVIVHVIGATSTGDPASANPACVPPPPLVTENTVPSFGANGILGVGPFINDCNSTGPCAPGRSASYYTCAASGTPACAQTTIPLDHQLQNPAVLFAKDNNGVIVEMPPVGASGMAAPVKGSLVFGIGTEGNNALGTATQLTMDPLSGVIKASLNGTQYPQSYLDSGSNANFFPTTIPSCPKPNQGCLCPGANSTVNENAQLQGMNGNVLAADFTVADANTLFMNNYAAFSNLAGNNSSASSLDLGLAFFYGRNIFTGFENPNVTPPYFAY
ncbi:MAG: DUF3443 family protein, partial [Sinobacteraceae bacterium]|nr:DUF3443 family protein [Nevskiaceae bacterium]